LVLKIVLECETCLFCLAHLIDIILTKGTRGINAFMEVLEFSYPEQYEHITGDPARPPSDGPSGTPAVEIL